MVGIVIVSHSEKLATGVLELANQMVQGAVNVPGMAIAAGIDDAENPLGTDALQIYQAIESVYSDQGVVVLMDLGSAILSAEMALEFLSEEQRDKVKLCEAPLVEGAIAAAVQAATGADIEQVLAEARGALSAKATQLLGVRSQESGVEVGQQRREIQLTIKNQMGLHARPAAKFVTTASHFQSDITLRNVTANSQSVNAKSINQVVTSSIRQGDEIAIAATGTDATEALAALQQLVEANFGEETVEPIQVSISTPPDQGEESQFLISNSSIGFLQKSKDDPPSPPYQGGNKSFNLGSSQNRGGLLAGRSPVHGVHSTDARGLLLNQLSGLPASPGIAIGNAVIYQAAIASILQQQADNPQEEWYQLQTACATARQQLQSLCQKTSAEAGKAEAAIFEAHLLYLEDPVLFEQAHQLIFDQNFSAAAAWKAVIDKTVAAYEALEDSYLQARATDVSDVGQRVLGLLTGTASTPLDLKEPAILVADDLTPSQTAQLDLTKVLGICTVAGGVTSHTGILARSLGIPAVMGVDAELLGLENGTLIALDGETGQVWVQPDDTELRELLLKRDRQTALIEASRITAQQPAITKDGHQVKVMANICGVADAKVAVDAGAQGVGLLRSEFLYLDRVIAPSEEEQLEVYRTIASNLAPHPLIIRTLDIGGDKPLPYLNLPLEANPFLGWRGIRLLLDYPDLLKTQLRAILRASYQYPIKVMFPMVSSLREIRAAKKILRATQADLRSTGIPFNEAMEVGIMVEVPAAVAIADQLAAEVDFFSIGTNDLSQYVMASDRTNPKVATLADAFEPAVLRMIQQTVNAAHTTGIWVGVCGELASSPLAAPILLGLGVDELSMNPPAIGAVKAVISQLTMEAAEAIASRVLQLDSSESVRDYLNNKLENNVKK